MFWVGLAAYCSTAPAMKEETSYFKTELNILDRKNTEHFDAPIGM